MRIFKRTPDDHPRLPKLCGADVELGNFIQGRRGAGGTGYDASRALLREIRGVMSDRGRNTHHCQCDECRHKSGRSSRARRRSPVSGQVVAVPYQSPLNGRLYDATGATRQLPGAASAGDGHISRVGAGGVSSAADPQDWGRKYLPENGGCCYIDLDHLEICLPEVLSAFDHLAAWHAMLRVARQAMIAANERLPSHERLHVLVNNSDGQNNSYGSHLNFLVTRNCWENIFWRKLQYMLFLSAYQVSSIVFAGQGKVGSENRTPHADYQISQRADFFEQLSGIQTTFFRPIVNSRNEALCGGGTGIAPSGSISERRMRRLHVIFYDSTLCHVASLLKVGVLQIILAMIEAEAVNLDLTLESPLLALRRYSHDPGLKAKARTCRGRQLTAVELQLLFFEEAARFVRRGGCAGVVPRAEQIVDLWGDTLEKLKARDWYGLTSRLDWVLKRKLIEQALRASSELDWASSEAKHLDLIYASLDPEDGLYWHCEKDGVVDALVSEADIERLRCTAPEDTRAWSRAMLLRKGADDVEDMNWDAIRFWFEWGYWSHHRTVALSNPLGFTKADFAGVDFSALSLEEALDRIEACEAREERPAHGEAWEAEAPEPGDAPGAGAAPHVEGRSEEDRSHDGA